MIIKQANKISQSGLMLVLFGMFVMICIPDSFSQVAGPRELAAKAATLLNFTQFVDWPPEAFASDTAPFVLAVPGVLNFKDALEEAIAGQKVKDHPIIIQRFADLNELTGCHLLFIPETEMGKFVVAQPSISRKYMLTVSDSTGFAYAGGMISFRHDDSKVRIQINSTAVRDAGLTISSKLLKLAEIVE